jgi:large repetitive protein
MKKLLQSFCWWCLLLLLAKGANAQVQYKIEYLSATQRYQVSLKPLANYSNSAGNTGSAQVTVVVPTGGLFTPTALQSQLGSWNIDNAIVRGPSENPGADYVSFYMPSPISNVNYVSGVEMPMFSFAATGSCVGNISLINNATDPFFPSAVTGTNSLGINVGNQISIYGYQNNLLANAYQSNYGSPAACPNVANNCIIQYQIVRTGNTYQVNMIPNVTYSGNGNITSTQQVTLKVPTGLVYTNLTSLTANAPYIQGSRVNAPSQASGSDYIMFNLNNLGTSGLTYTAGQSVPLFKFDVPGTCVGNVALMPDSDPFTANTSYNSKQQITVFGYGQPDAPICFSGSGSVPCTNAPPTTCQVEYEIEQLANGKFQVSMIPKVTYTGTNNTTSTQQVTLKVPTGFQYTGLTSLISGAPYIQGSRVNAPSQAPTSDYILFNLNNLGTNALTYTNGVKVPLFTFDKVGNCQGATIALMPDSDPFTANTSYNSKQQLTVLGYGQPDIPICLKGTGSVVCQDAPPTTCQIEYEIEHLANGKFQVSMIPKVTYTGNNATTSTQQVTLKVPTGFQYTGLTSLISGAPYIQGSRVNAPSQAPAFDYILFNLNNLGTNALTYTNGVKVPLFTFDKSGNCPTTPLALMPDNDPFTANPNYNSKQQLTVFGYGQPDIPICIKGTGTAICTDPVPTNCTISYKLENVNGCEYQVSMTPNVTWNTANSITKAAKITLRVPHNCFQVSNLTSLNFGANFVIANTALAPADNPAYDYICFSMTTVPTVAVPYVQGQAFPLFTFKNSGTCCGNIELMPNTDPFANGNSLGQNFDQHWQTSGTGAAGVTPCIEGNPIPCISSQNSNLVGPDKTICQNNNVQLNVTGAFVSYNWSPATGLSATNVANPTASPLVTTTYYVTATTAGNCAVKDTIVVNVGSGASITNVNTANPTNCSGTTGSITVNATLASGTIEYSINNGSTWQNSNVFANLAAGSYTIKVRKQGTSCETTFAQNPVVLTASGAPSIVNVASTNPTCGSSNGQISINVAGTGGPFRYSVNNGTSFQTSSMFVGLAAGTYNIVVTDASGSCSVSYTNVVLAAPTAPSILSVTPTNTSDCTLTNGSLSVNATGGVGPLKYSIDGTNWQTSTIFNNLAAGSYLVSVRNADNTCMTSATSPTVITQPVMPSISNVTATVPTACSTNNGVIVVTANGGAAPLQYSMDGGATWQLSNTFNGLASGSYYIMVRNNGATCAKPFLGNPVVLNTPVAPAILSVVKTVQSSCGVNDGSIVIQASGSGSLEYSINNGAAWQASNTFNGLSSGTYNIVVRAAGNAACTSIVLNCVLPALTASTISNAVATAASDCSTADGTISITATGGTAPLQYSINGTTWQNSNVFVSVLPGTYTVRVRNYNGSCVQTYPTALLVGQPTAPSISNTVATAATCGQTDGTITVTASGGTGPLEYSRDNINWQTNNVFQNVPAGAYNTYVRNANNTCPSPANNPIIVPQTGGLNITGITLEHNTTCGANTGKIIINATGGQAPLQYSINGGVTFQASNTFSGLATGTYNMVIKSANNSCPAMVSPLTITGPNAPQIASVVPSNPTGCAIANGSLSVIATGGVAPLEYSIDGTNWQSSNNFYNLAANSYTARVRSASASTCVVSATTPVILNSTSTAPSISNVAKVSPTSCSAANGSITVSATPNTGVQYSIDNIHWQVSNVFANLAAGSYTVFVRNNDGSCATAYGQNPVLLNAGGAHTITNVSLTNPSSCGLNDGQISIYVSGAGGAFRYSINGGTSFQASNMFVGLAAGTYNIVVTDQSTVCSVAYPSVVLTAPVAPSITAVTPSNISDCILSNGSISVTATGGSGIYEYSIDGTTWQASNIFNNLSAGAYLIKVRNASDNSCVVSAAAPIVISKPTLPSVTSVIQVAPTSCATPNGSINVTATGGSGTYQYSIDNGVTWQNSGAFNALTSGTYYVMVRNIGSTCSTAFPGNPVVINTSAAPAIYNVTKTLPSTCGGNDGSIVINATTNNSTATLTYSINSGITFQSSNTFNGLSAGNYNIVVRALGSASCSSSVPNCQIPATTAPTIASATATASSDCSLADGTITVTASGGTAPLQYSINGSTWQTNNVFNGVAPGSYTIRVRNSNGSCVQTYSTAVVVTQPTTPTVTNSTATAATCGQTDGSISITATGGTGPLEYSRDNINWQTNNVFQYVPAGSYNVYVRNADNSCPSAANNPVVVTQTGGTNISNVTLTNNTTCGTNAGQIVISANGGTAPLQYSINGGVTYQASNTFNALAAGTYNIVVRNALGTCPAVFSPVTITAPTAPQLLTTIAVNPSACTSNDGTLTIFANGGQAPLQYSLDGNIWQTSNTFANLAAGSYLVRIRNNDGSCVVSASTPVVLSSGSAPVINSVAKTDPTACGAANGSITITATPNTGVEYSIDNIHWQVSTTFSNILPGSYTAYIRLANGTCKNTYNTPIVLNASGAQIISNVATIDPSSCGQNNGQISIAVTGNNGPFRYSINGGTSYQLSNMFTGLAAGTYNIKVENTGSTCVVTAPAVTLTAPTAPVLTNATATPSTDCSLADGSITINANGGQAPLKYSIDGVNWQTSNTFTNVAAGSYLVRVRNADNSCMVVASAITTVNAPAQPNITGVVSTAPTSCSSNNGSITVNATGGAGQLEYSIDNINWQTQTTFNNLASGTYYVAVRNQDNSCPKLYAGNPVVINATTAPAIVSVVKADVSNCSSNDGSLVITVSPNTGLEYSINNGTTWQTNNNFNALAAGTYNVKVRFANNTACSSSVPSIVISQPTQPTVSNLSATPTTDCNTTDGTITVNANGGTAPLQYSINNITWQNGNVFYGVSAGTYTIYVRNANGSCVYTHTSTIAVTQPNAPSVPTATATASTCGQNSGSITITANGGTAPLEYSIDNINWQNSNIFNNVAAGLYRAYVRNANNSCVTLANSYTTVGQTGGVIINTVSVNNSTSCSTNNGSITISGVSGATSPEYSINGGVTFQTTNTFNNLGAGVYTIVVRNGNGTCPAVIAPISITAPTPPVLNTTFAQNPTSCSTNDGTISIFASNNGLMQYSIDGINWQSNNIFANVAPGSYTARVRPAGNTNCVTIASSPINLLSPITAPNIASVSSTPPTACGSSNGTITINATGSAGLQYSIDNIHWQNAGSFANVAAGSYTAYVRNADGTCKIPYVANPIVLAANGGPVVVQTLSINPNDCVNPNGSITVIANGGTGPLKYSINGGAFQLSNTFTNLTTGTYNILVSDSNGSCQTPANATLTSPTAPTIPTGTANAVTDCVTPNGSITVSSPLGTGYEYSLNGGASWQSATVFNNLAAATYMITVRRIGTNCTENSLPVLVSQPASPIITAVNATYSLTNCSITDGQIVINVSNAGAWQYSIDGGLNWQSSNTFNNLIQGSYTVMVRNSSSTTCAKPYQGNPVVLSAPKAPSITNVLVEQSTTCNGADGKISITASGFNPPLQYSLNGGAFQTSNVFANLTAGTYTIKVKDALNCEANATSVTIKGNVSPNALTATPTPVSDCNVANGTITVSAVTGGTAPYEYSINGITWQSSNQFFNLAAGSYTVRVRSIGSACTFTNSAATVITSPTSPVINSVTPTQATCGQNNGTITVSGSAGALFSIDGINYQSGAVFANLAPGMYTVFVKNSNGTCNTPYALNPIDLTAPNAIDISNVAVNNPTDCNGSDGKITITASGGIAPLSYSIDGGLTFQTSNTFSGLTTKNYNIVVRGSGVSVDCPVLYPTVKLTAPASPKAQVAVVDQPTNCSNNGKITVYASGGIAPIEYSIDGATWQVSNIFNNIGQGNYTVSVRNAGGTCVKPMLNTVNVTSPSAAIISTINKVDPTTCTTTNGSITVIATPNTNVQYSIDNIHWQTSNVFANLPSGAYSVYIRNADGTCASSYAQNPVVLIGAGAPVIIGVNKMNVTSCSNVDGAITIQMTTATTQFKYSIDNGASYQLSNYFTGLTAGTYNVKVTDIAGICTAVFPNVIVSGVVSPTFGAVTATPVSNCGTNTGSIAITSNGGIAPIQYSINNGGTWTTNNVFSGLAAGTYAVMMRNANGTCVQVYGQAVLVDEPQKPTISAVASTDPSVCGSTNGSITITATGGTGTYEYSINGTTWQTNNIFTNLSSGAYTIFVRNAGSTCATQYALVVNTTPVAAANIISVGKQNPTICNGANGSISIVAVGNSPLEYSINGGASYQSASIFNNLATGNYNIIVRNVGGTCTVTYPTVSIIAPTAPVIVSATPSSTSDCAKNDGKITVIATSNNALEYSTDGVNWYSNNVLMNLAAGTYTVSVRIAGTTCITVANTATTVTAPTSSVTVANVSKTNPTICGANNGSISISANPSAGAEYSIDGLNWKTTGTFNNLPAGTYLVYVRGASGICPSSYATNPVVLSPNIQSPIVTTVVKTNVTDCGLSNGSLTISATGGTAPYGYSIDGGTTWQTTSTYSNLAAGSYDIVVRNNDQSCPAIHVPTVIAAPIAPTLVTTILTKPVDCAQPTGKITVIAVGPNPIQYSIDNGTTWTTNNVFSNLGPGYYNIKIRNADGTCAQTYGPNPVVSCEFDLALRKKLSPNQDSVVRLGSDVNFDITVFNQGAVIAKDIEVVDYLPLGTILSPLDNSGWSYVNTTGSTAPVNPAVPLKVRKVLTDPLEPGKDITTSIKLRVMYGGPNVRFVNIAEIAGAKDQSGVTRQDGDSTPDDTKGNDKEKDDVVDDKGTTDEDDEDPAPFKLDDYDPQGYIYCDKAGTLLKGGTIQLVSAPAGGAIYFANDANGNPLNGSSGTYQFFTNGIPGTYNITYNNPSGYQLSTMILPQAGSFNPAGKDGTSIDKDGTVNNIVELGSGAANDSLVNKAPAQNPYYLSFTLNANETTIIGKNNIPVSCACVTSIVCVDANGDGIPSAGETGLNGVQVIAYNCLTNQQVATSTTANGGKYKISNLLAGNYKLKFVLPNGYSFANTNSGQPLNVSAATGETACFPLAYNGCEEKAVCVNACPILTLSPNVTICAGSSTILSVSGGSTTYTWSPAIGLSATTGASVTASPSATTVYTVTSVAGSCTSTASVTVTVGTPPAANSFTVTPVQPSTCAATNGSITVTSIPANANIEYSINNGISWQNNGSFTNLAPGTYLVKVRNTGSTCSTAYLNNPVDLTPASAANITAVSSVNPTNCTTPNGSITITANGGAGALQYSVNGGASYQTSSVFNNLAAGTYTISVKNADGSCPISYPVVTLTNNAPVINAVNVVSDCANNNRSITILASGGAAPLEYSINNGVTWTTSNVFNNLAPGYYNVAVRNFNGTCVVNYTGGQISLCAFDLAVKLTLAPSQPSLIRLGDVVTYKVKIYNQGAIPAKNIVLTSYIPKGMLVTGNNGWTQINDSTATYTYTGTINPGDSTTLMLMTKLVYGSPNTSLKNVVEIKDAQDPNGNHPIDIDSTPDDNRKNDTEINDVVNQNGKTGGDEDDSDPELVTLDNFDPSGYIYCEKTGRVMTGGKIKLVSAPAGGEIFFSTDNSGKLLDGNSGMYQVFTNGISGTYTLGYEHPSNFPISTTCTAQNGAFDPKGKDGTAIDKDGQVNGTIHLGSVATNGYMADKSCTANPYYLSFVLAKDEKVLIATNNIPVACAVVVGRIVTDTNGDGQAQANEPGVAGLVVKLYDCKLASGAAIASTVTDKDGKYTFDGLAENDYKVQIITPNGHQVGGGNFNATGYTPCTKVKLGECKEFNGVITMCPTINNVITVMPWCPKNNGVIIVDAVCQGDLKYSIDGGKTYQNLNAFVNLAPGSYTIKVKNDVCESEYSKVIVLACENDPNGGKGSISGKAFKTCTDSGIKGASKGITGVKVTLTSSTGATLNATTNAAGLYNFTNIDAGTYTVTFDKPTGFNFAKQNQGNDDKDDSDVDASGKTGSITVAANQLVDNVDAGLQDVQGPTVTFTHPALIGKKDGDTVYMECSEEQVFVAKDATAKDNCDPTSIVKMEEDPAILSKDCSKDGYIVKMHCGWAATDECGNKTIVWLNIIVRDTKAPSLVGVPADITIDDKQTVPVAATVTATDKCDKAAQAIFSESKNGDVITRTWTASDGCGNKTTGVQVITIKKGNTPCTFGAAPVPVTYASTCAGKDGKAKLTPTTYTYKWQDGLVADTRLDLDKGTYKVTATNADGCTYVFDVIIKDGCVANALKFNTASELRQVQCSNPVREYCFNMDYIDFKLNYDLLDNGQPFAGKIQPCSIQKRKEYSLEGVASNGLLSVEKWIVDGKSNTFQFNGLADLTNKMNQYNPGGNWKFDPILETVYTESDQTNTYGDLKIKNTIGSLAWVLQPSSYSTPVGLKIKVEGIGKHELVLAHKVKAYQDTLRLQYVCTETKTYDYDLEVGESARADLSTTELVGVKCTMSKILVQDISIADIKEKASRLSPAAINIEGMLQGYTAATYTMCDEFGICDTAKIRVTVRASKSQDNDPKDKTVKVYTGFSPNGDGINDVFQIDNVQYHPDNTLTVFNRWGNTVYLKNGYNNTWKGTYNDNPLPDGTYFYLLEIKGEKVKSGYVEIRK